MCYDWTSEIKVVYFNHQVMNVLGFLNGVGGWCGSGKKVSSSCFWARNPEASVEHRGSQLHQQKWRENKKDLGRQPFHYWIHPVMPVMVGISEQLEIYIHKCVCWNTTLWWHSMEGNLWWWIFLPFLGEWKGEAGGTSQDSKFAKELFKLEFSWEKCQMIVDPKCLCWHFNGAFRQDGAEVKEKGVSFLGNNGIESEVLDQISQSLHDLYIVHDLFLNVVNLCPLQTMPGQKMSETAGLTSSM